MKTQKHNWLDHPVSRRGFIKTSCAAAMSLAVKNVYAKEKAPKKTLRFGFIGLGQQAQGLLSGFMNFPQVEVIAGCDVYEVKRKRFANKVLAFYANTEKAHNVKMYERYQELLARPDIDVVVIATPDHWHAKIAIDACKAGKDIYLEKPLTFTIDEGRALVKAVRKYNRVLQVGSQQRSDARFKHAVKLVQDGKLGKISKIYARVGPPPAPYSLPEEPIPSGLNWNLWLGPLDKRVHYNNELNPIISLDPEQNETFWAGWRWYKETGGGLTTDWGAHMFDIAQWAIGMDGYGPDEVIPAGYGDNEYMTFKYKNGVVMTEQPFDEAYTQGVKFFGEKGWIEVSRSHFLSSDSSWNFLQPMDNDRDNRGAHAPHMESFLKAIETRKDPNVPVEVGHSTCTTCLLGNIATDLGRPIKWNPDKQQFIDDKEAENHRLFSYTYNEEYSL